VTCKQYFFQGARNKGLVLLNTQFLKCWVVTEGLAGTENQCLGIAEALGVSYEVRHVSLRPPWKALSPFLGFENRLTFTPPLEPPFPDLVLAAGRKAIAAARYIRRASAGKTFTVFVQDPRVAATNFDLVAVPEHDSLRGSNVVVTKAAPNRITNKKLQMAMEKFPAFENLKKPRIAVLVGGNSKAYTMTPEIMRNLAHKLKTLDAGLMITTSRRTGAENEMILKNVLKDTGAWIWDNQGENPYFAMLGWADYILVTADSVSMLSEACTTGKPVYMINLQGGGRRVDALHRNLVKAGALRVFDGKLEHWTYTPLRDAETVAVEIRRRLTDRGLD
jgi:mitochondrial fission protein ELM1